MQPMTMRHFDDLPLEDGLALWGLLIEQGMVTEDHYVTPLGEEYIRAITQPLDLTNMSEIVKDEQS